MRPIAEAERHDTPRLIDEPVPGVTAMVDDLVVGAEHAVRQPVVAHELPHVLLRVELIWGMASEFRCDGRILLTLLLDPSMSSVA